MIRMYDIIEKKQKGQALNQKEIAFWVQGVVQETIPDYQTTALLMAIYWKGMNHDELAMLTKCMAQSGDMIDLSSLPGIKVDKHSTGGVGDKTTLIVAPIVAAAGGTVAKMSGRGLGFTGGTLDKLESIPGCSVALSMEKFFNIVRLVGCSVAGQTGNLAPADKKLYALRDVTATVASIPLIASSIMSKKLAAGADKIVLDVKTGSGAFMKEKEQAMLLAKEMISIGTANGKETVALVTNMNAPLGNMVGNALEVREAVSVLQGKGPKDLEELSLLLAAEMLFLSEKGSREECLQLARCQMQSGAAFQKFKAMIVAQGGDGQAIEDLSRLPQAAWQKEILAQQTGFLAEMDAEKIGIGACFLGAGRETKEDAVDASAGIQLLKKPGEAIQKGEPWAILYTNKKDRLPDAEKILHSALSLEDRPKEAEPILFARCIKDDVLSCF